VLSIVLTHTPEETYTPAVIVSGIIEESEITIVYVPPDNPVLTEDVTPVSVPNPQHHTKSYGGIPPDANICIEPLLPLL
jgi:hypothetical protein